MYNRSKFAPLFSWIAEIDWLRHSIGTHLGCRESNQQLSLPRRLQAHTSSIPVDLQTPMNLLLNNKGPVWPTYAVDSNARTENSMQTFVNFFEFHAKDVVSSEKFVPKIEMHHNQVVRSADMHNRNIGFCYCVPDVYLYMRTVIFLNRFECSSRFWVLVRHKAFEYEHRTPFVNISCKINNENDF